MKMIFFGLNEFGLKGLQEIIKSELDVSLAVVPKTNKNIDLIKLVKKNGISLFRFDNNLDCLRTEIYNLNPDLIVIASFTKVLPQEIIYLPKLGTINVHPGLLPNYRGAHPINWALINGEKQTGITIHYVDEKVDTGAIIIQKKIPIYGYDDINTLKNKLAILGGKLLIKTIKKIYEKKGYLSSKKQKTMTSIILAPKRIPEQGRIDWKKSSKDIINLIRALKSPLPNAFTFKKNVKIEFYDYYLTKKPGEVLTKFKNFYLISTVDGIILLKTKNRLKIGDVLR